MRIRAWTVLPVVGLAALCASSAGAQVSASASASAEMSVSARAMAAVALPSTAMELRASGVPRAQVRVALATVHAHHLPAPEVHTLFRHSVTAIHTHGPIPHFGGFVRMKVRGGIRGPKLVHALRIEHKKRGRPHPPGLAKGHALDTPGHRRHGHSAPHGPPGHGKPKGKVDVRIKDKGGGRGSVRVRAKPGKPSAGGRGSVRVRGGGKGGGKGGKGRR